MTKVTAECTWGDGPDVLVVAKHDEGKTQYLDLTADEALQLIGQLLLAAAQSKKLEEACEQYHKEESC